MNFLASSLASRKPSATSMISQMSSKSGTTIAHGLQPANNTAVIHTTSGGSALWLGPPNLAGPTNCGWAPEFSRTLDTLILRKIIVNLMPSDVIFYS